VSLGVSVEVVAVVVNIKTLKKRLIDCTQVRDGVERGRGEETRKRVDSRSVGGQVYGRRELLDSLAKQGRFQRPLYAVDKDVGTSLKFFQ
jgi:hypothetical protein